MVAAPAPEATRAEFDAMGARVLVGVALAVGVIGLASALANELAGSAGFFSLLRGVYGAGLLAAGALAAWLQRGGRPRAASLLVLLTIVLLAWAHVVATGLGLHALVLTAALLAVSLAGVLVHPLAALALAVLNGVLMLAVYAAERSGALPGLAAATAVTLDERLVGMAVFTGAALVVSLLLARVLGASLGRALHQEHKLVELLAIVGDWTWEADRHARLTSLSPSFEARTGRPVAEFMRIGEPGGPRLADDDETKALLADLRARRPYRDRTITFTFGDGSLLVARGSADPVFDGSGRFTGWRGVSRNVTAEALAQRTQRRTQQMLDRLVQMSPDALCVARREDGRLLLVNPAFLQLMQVSEAEALGRNGVELGHWRDAAAARALRERLRRDGHVRDLRTRLFVGPSAEPRDVVITAAAFEWDGEPVAVLTVRDITDAERARLETEAILDNASVGIALVRERRFERVNPRFEAMFGRAVGSLGGRDARLLFPSAHSFEAFARLAERRIAAGRPLDLERRVVVGDGHEIVVRLRARPVEAARPLDRGTIWVAEDITAQRRSEGELAQAKRLAEAANDAKSAFLATMSHEIRTPLNGVLGLARLLQEASLSAPRRQEYLSHLVDAAELLSGVVSDVLDLSKIEAGHLQLEAIAFDLHAVALGIFRSFEPLGRERGLEMDGVIEPGVPVHVRGDPVRVRQIVGNYLNNALKFTVRGSITLRVRAGADGRVRIEVHDTGVGVPESTRTHLFTPFVQGDSSTTRRFGGTGLGLSICRQLAERMGGRVGVDSDGASGSCFWAELRLPEAPEAADETNSVPPAGSRPLAGLTVLIAEDNPVNMLIAAAMLRRLGAAVIEAEDGHRAVALARESTGTLDAVLMDLHMPELDGLEATRALRADPLTAGVPVFALSAAVLDQERHLAATAGMDGFIDKPVAEDDLLRALLPLVRPASIPV